MSLAELKEAVVALSTEERRQLRDLLDALDEGVTVAQLYEIDRMLVEALDSKEPNLSTEEFRAEMKAMLESLPKKKGTA